MVFSTKNEERIFFRGLVLFNVIYLVICRREPIMCPKTTDDEIKDIVWILGFIDGSNYQTFLSKESQMEKSKTIKYT